MLHAVLFWFWAMLRPWTNVAEIAASESCHTVQVELELSTIYLSIHSSRSNVRKATERRSLHVCVVLQSVSVYHK
jgi:hypothetical protein